MAITKDFTQLPTVSSAQLTDIICAVNGYVSPSNPGLSVQESLQQVYNLFQSNMVLYYPGNPNGHIAGSTYQFCWDTVDLILYLCTITGTSVSAVWTAITQAAPAIVPPSLGGTGVANPTAHTIPIAEGSSNFNFLGPLTNGQVLIGSTGFDPVPGTLIAGTNINIANAAGTITINATGGAGFSWNIVSGTSQTMSSNQGYISTNAGLVTLTLPATSNIGDVITIVGNGPGGWLVQCGGGQTINVGSATTSVAGSVASAGSTDTLSIVCTIVNAAWQAYAPPLSTGLTIV